VVTLPEVVFVRPRDPRQTVATVLRKPGVVTMTATGIEEEGGAPTTVTADCEFGVETLRIRATMDRFTVTEADNAYLNTRCY
jgi:hypothetical protein